MPVDWLTMLVVAATAWAPPPQDTSGADGITLRTFQFYRDHRTVVNAFVEVPHRLLGGVMMGPGGFAVFRLDIAVADSAGTVLVRDGWTRSVGWETFRVPGSSSVEAIAFAVAPGTYRLHVTVHDSATAEEASADVTVIAYATRPPGSAVLLASGIRRAAAGGGEGDTTPAAGEIRKGDLFITTGPSVLLRPTAARLFYYDEVYRDSAGSVPWALRVLDGTGRAVVATAAATAMLDSGGGSLVGSVDLTGLPPGRYDLAVRIGEGADSLTRRAPFQVGGFELEGRIAEAVRAGGAEPGDVFAGVTEAQLDTLFAPLTYVPEAGELSVYRGLTVEGKRRFLREFWRRRDPSPGTPANEAQAGFYQRIAQANRRFREGGAAEVPGWRTDRGRIFVRYGEPDDVLRRPQTGPDLPWEVWKYSKDRALKYVFLDRTRVGNYALIFTNDRTERSLPDWSGLLSSQAIAEIANF